MKEYLNDINEEKCVCRKGWLFEKLKKDIPKLKDIIDIKVFKTDDIEIRFSCEGEEEYRHMTLEKYKEFNLKKEDLEKLEKEGVCIKKEQ